ncbi:uncharacterized protein LOC133744339 [Rosa rugosa]|uniref:uncharacterized protein LOC133744339 n=1 Tax=Rosa rugosa TaxID=74645 RepID=UPI002B412B3B|nr:uncharacterized protein LOC133744339 [Rosa rugosa]
MRECGTKKTLLLVKLASFLHHVRLQEFRFHNMKQTHSHPSRARVVRWCAPAAGFLKINVDGSFNHITRKGGLGFVVRNELGHMLAGGACPLSGLISPEHAEILACKRAVEFAADHALIPAVLETDASEVKRQLTQHISSNTSVLGRIYDDVGNFLETLMGISVSYVGRKGNLVAHTLAAHACTLRQDSFYFSTPAFLQSAIAAEFCNV